MLVVENQYIPCVNWLKNSINDSYIKIFEYEQYQKMTFKSRCVVAGSNGLINLSIPLKNGRDQKGIMKEVEIANHENWRKLHWRTLTSCYAKSPFWEYYGEVLAPIFEKEYRFLFDLNLAIIQKICRVVDRKLKIEVSSEPWPALDARLVNGAEWRPNNFQDTASPIRYNQLFEDRIGFQPNISCLDLLCMEGPEAIFLLK